MSSIPVVRPFDESWTEADAQAYAIALKKRSVSIGRSFDAKRSAATPKGWVQARAALRLAGVGHLLWLVQQRRTHPLVAPPLPEGVEWVSHWNQLFSRPLEELAQDSAWVHAVWQPFENAVATAFAEALKDTASAANCRSAMVGVVSEGWFAPAGLRLGFCEQRQEAVFVGFKDWVPELGICPAPSFDWVRLSAQSP